MSHYQDPMKHIANMLETKCSAKQEAYRNLKSVFEMQKEEAHKVIASISGKIKEKDKDITLAVINVNENEFHVKVAGDLLVFFMHSNIITLDKEHRVNKSKYVADNYMRKYLGQINVYNFMSDSFKYKRINDPGYLISRFFVNFENHFFVEGDGQLNYMFEGISGHPLTPADVSIFIQLAISQAIDSDLVTMPFPSIRTITLQQKMEKSMTLGGGQKIGFQMSYQQDL